jgi:hypothetical protein
MATNEGGVGSKIRPLTVTSDRTRQPIILPFQILERHFFRSSRKVTRLLISTLLAYNFPRYLA